MAKKTPRNEAKDESNTPVLPSPRRARTSSRRQTARKTATADVASSGTSASSDSVDDDSTSVTYDPSEEDIRLRAYLRYLERGGGQGLEFEDWVEAERELKRKK